LGYAIHEYSRGTLLVELAIYDGVHFCSTLDLSLLDFVLG
jgi:hypothetical protein